MYGRMVRDVAGDMGWSAIIASVASGDSLPRTGGPSSAMWQNSLELVAQSQPDVIVMANSWVAKLKYDPERLRLSLEALAPHICRDRDAAVRVCGLALGGPGGLSVWTNVGPNTLQKRITMHLQIIGQPPQRRWFNRLRHMNLVQPFE